MTVSIVYSSSTGIQLTKEIQANCGPTLKEFKAKLTDDDCVKSKIASLKKEVEEFAVRFPLPGFDSW